MKSAIIRIFPDPILRRKAQPVTVFDRALLRLVALLTRTMRRQLYGIGIAAPQIGISKAVAIVDVSGRVPQSERLILINPTIMETKDPEIRKEGCMSLPDYTAFLKRHRWVRVRYQTVEGLACDRVCTGLEAICVEHEVDHLNGVMFLDRVACLRTDMHPRSGK